MIKVIDGDLLQATEDIIGHQVNCQGAMNSGVAKAIRKRYPKAYIIYKAKCDYFAYYNKLYDLLGSAQFIMVDTEKHVANLFGQFRYGYDGRQYTNEVSLGNALKLLREYAEGNGLSVALPFKIGCDRGGADWNVVSQIIDDIFNGYEVTLYRLVV